MPTTRSPIQNFEKKKKNRKKYSLWRLDCGCPVNELVSRCLHLWRAPKGPRIWSSLPTTCSCYLIEHQNWVLTTLLVNLYYNMYLLPDWTPELSTAALWVLSTGQIQFLWVMEGGDKTSKWIRTHLTCSSDGIFVLRSLSIKSHCKSRGNWAKTSKYISPHLHFT